MADPIDYTSDSKSILSIHKDKVSKLTGSCLCGGVSYKINGPVRDVVNCFCSQCQKTSGNFVASTRVNKNDIEIVQDKTLQWHECLADVFRGFCNNCGGNIFWENKKAEDNGLSIMAGTLDGPTNLKTVGSIYTEDANDYCIVPSFD